MGIGSSIARHKTRKVESQKDPQRINVLFVCNEWNSSKGGLSTFNRETAINLAKTSSDTIKVHCYVSQSTQQEREDAESDGVNIITAKSIPGTSDPLEWLRLPPPELAKPDIVVGHGLKFGTPAYCIVEMTECKWVQCVHVCYEDLGKFKLADEKRSVPDTIEENEKKQKEEIKLCKAANMVVAVGSRLQQKYNRCLPDIEVGVITPGILESFKYLSDQKRNKVSCSPDEFSTFVFGRASYEDLVLKGYDIIADAVGSLEEKFKVTFVGASEGQHRNIEKWFLQNTKVKRKQLTICGYCDQNELKRMFYGADLVAMPSRTEGFGLVALEAISAGVPVLVTSESGIAKALERVEGGKPVIVQSEELEEWAQKIEKLSKKKPEERLDDAICLRENYDKTYSWSTQCKRFSEMIGVLMTGSCHGNHVDDHTSPVMSGEREQRAPVEDTHITVSEEAVATNLLYEDLPLEEIPWYFGKLNRLSAEELLQSHHPGTYLVRKGESDTKSGQYVISLRDGDKYQHQKIETLADGKLVLEGHEGHLFPNLAASVQYFVTCLKNDIHLAPLEKEKDNEKEADNRRSAEDSISFASNREDPSSGNDSCKNMFTAAESDDIDVIATLLSKGAYVNSRNSDGETPLMIAAANGRLTAFNLLLERGADPTLKYNNKWTVMHWAAKGGNDEIIEKLLSFGLDIDSRNTDGATPLMSAAGNGRLNAFNLLLQRGADPTLKDNNGWTVLHWAAQGGNDEIIEKLLSLGVDIDSRNSEGVTPLMIAAGDGRLNAFNLLLERGTDLALKNTKGSTVLHWAAKGGNDEIIAKLLSLGLDIDSSNSEGVTPLMIAAGGGRLNAFNLLLERGADPTLKDNNGWTVLHWAAQGGNDEIIEKLLSLGVDIESRKSDGVTPLMIAAGNGRINAFNLLLERGADPTLKDNDGWTVRYWAVNSRITDIPAITDTRYYGQNPDPGESCRGLTQTDSRYYGLSPLQN